MKKTDIVIILNLLFYLSIGLFLLLSPVKALYVSGLYTADGFFPAVLGSIFISISVVSIIAVFFKISSVRRAILFFLLAMNISIGMIFLLWLISSRMVLSSQNKLLQWMMVTLLFILSSIELVVLSRPSKTRDSIKNFLLVAASIVVCFSVCYPLYRYICQNRLEALKAERVKSKGYSLEFCNQKGQRITDQKGLFKLMIDPYTIYRNYPGQELAYVSTDSFGFRKGHPDNNRDIIMVLGGSAAFGKDVISDEVTFSSQMNLYLPAFRTINAGVIGFLSGQELSFMVHYLDRFNPVLYVVFDGWNDVFDHLGFGQPRGKGRLGYNNNFFEIEDRLATYTLSNPEEEKKEGKDSAIESYETIEAYFDDVIQVYCGNLDKMHCFAKSRRAHFLVVFQPELGNKTFKTKKEITILTRNEKRTGYLTRKIPQKYKIMIKEAKKFCKAKRIDFMDICEIPEFNDNEITLFSDPVHMNEKGHQIVARIISDKVKTLNLPEISGN